jgi:hypothetical protein
MSVLREFPSQREVGKRELQVRPSCFEAARVRFELARKCLRTGCSLIAVALAVALAGCVTTSAVPSSPFLTAVVRLNPFPANSNGRAMAANASPSAMSGNAPATTLRQTRFPRRPTLRARASQMPDEMVRPGPHPAHFFPRLHVLTRFQQIQTAMLWRQMLRHRR